MLEFSKHLVECWSHDEQDLIALSDKLVRSRISGGFSQCLGGFRAALSVILFALDAVQKDMCAGEELLTPAHFSRGQLPKGDAHIHGG